MSRKKKEPGPPRPRLGQQVWITHYVKRVTVPNEGAVGHGPRHGFGYREEWQRRELPKPLAGIYIGARTYQNGWIEYNGEDGTEWHSLGPVPVWLVVTNEYRKPIPCAPQDVETVASFLNNLPTNVPPRPDDQHRSDPLEQSPAGTEGGEGADRGGAAGTSES